MAAYAYSDKDSLEELRSAVTRRTALATITIGIFGAWYFLIRRDLPLSASGLVCLLVLLGRGVQILLFKDAARSRQILIGGLLGLLFAGMLLFHSPVLPWIGVPCIVISAVLANNGGVITATSIAVFSAALQILGGREYALVELIVTVGLTAFLSELSAYTLFTTIHWYGTMQARSEQLLEETRNHRAELRQTLKSLEMAYETQKNIQAELIRARKQAEDGRRLKEQFAANISHELRTPLNLILGFSEIMYRSPEIYGEVSWSPQLRRDVHQIYRSSQHLLDMIDDILDLSRFEMAAFSLTLEHTDLKPLLQETVEIARDLTRGWPVELRLEMSPDLPPVEIDRTRIRQVLLNLLNNACSFTEQGVVMLSAWHNHHEVLISVRDTGAGIPADKLPNLFDEFYQVDPSLRRTHKGAGLGLAISKHFVEAHGGIIRVESEIGVGTCFTFTLPLTEQFALDHSSAFRFGVNDESEPLRPCALVLEKDTAIVAMMRRYVPDYDLIQVKDETLLDEVRLKLHPKVIIRNMRPGHPIERSWEDSGVPLIECSIASLSWIAEDLAVAGCLIKPVSGSVLLDEIERFGTVHDVLVIDDDRDFILLIERLLQVGSREKTNSIRVHRAYDGAHGLVAISDLRPDLILLDVDAADLHGSNVLEQIQTNPALCNIPVLLLTSERAIDDPPVQNSVSVYSQDGLYPIEIFGCLNGIINSIRPRFATQSKSR